MLRGASTQAWAAHRASLDQPAVGAWTLVLSSVQLLATTSSGKGYVVHGTLTATLPPATGQSGNVTLSASF